MTNSDIYQLKTGIKTLKASKNRSWQLLSAVFSKQQQH